MYYFLMVVCIFAWIAFAICALSTIIAACEVSWQMSLCFLAGTVVCLPLAISTGVYTDEWACRSYGELSGLDWSYSPETGCRYKTAGGLWVTQSVYTSKHLTLNPEL